MDIGFKITKKQKAFIDAKEDEVLYGGCLERGSRGGADAITAGHETASHRSGEATRSAVGGSPSGGGA